MSAKPRVLIADALSPAAVKIFAERGIDADTRVGLTRDQLIAAIGDYDGLAVRSATKVTADVLQHAKRLKVVGRAGIGVDNIDMTAATATGVIVMNTPFGNSITTAEHAIALMLALARDIPAANASTQAGKWEKNRFLGVEVYGKTLGLVGCGNIGSIVADRARGLKMRVVAYDPYLSPERAAQLSVDKVELDELFSRADFLSLHTPLTAETRGIISAAAIAKMKKGARLINCARGGLADERAVKAALDSGQLAGAAFDVFEEEPAKATNILFGTEHVVATPHLGASTAEAQENVALQVAEQISDYLLTGAIANALNMPSLTAEEAAHARPWIALSEKLGLFAGQLTESSIGAVELLYEGTAAAMNTRALTQAALAGLLRPTLAQVNMVNAPVIAKERGMQITEVRRDQQGAYEGHIRLTVTTEQQTRSVAGTVFSDGRPRLIQVKGINVNGEFAPHMLYVTNEDKPGMIGRLGTLLGNAGINIASFALGRAAPGADAIALVEVDSDVGPDVLAAIAKLPLVRQARALSF